jgi:hypothetical protein
VVKTFLQINILEILEKSSMSIFFFFFFFFFIEVLKRFNGIFLGYCSLLSRTIEAFLMGVINLFSSILELSSFKLMSL